MKEEKERREGLESDIYLSIIIPVYNMEEYLARCLDSVTKAISKVNESVEVLVINDGSTDSSESIIATYCEKYPYMRRFNKVNGGLSDVKNYGLERAKGEFVIFLDSDDYVDENMYCEMLEKLQEEQADIVTCDIKLTYDDSARDVVWPCRTTVRNTIFHQVVDMPMMPASWNKIVRRKLYEGLSFPVGKNNEDIAVTPILLARANKIAAVDKPFYSYYQRTGSIQNSEFSEKRFVVVDTSKLCMERLSKEQLDEVRFNQIKGSVYLHQVLAIALYPIKQQRFLKRYSLIRKYMKLIYEYFPDIWDDAQVKEFQTYESKAVQMKNRTSVLLLKYKMYLAISFFWSICNWYEKRH